MHKCVRLLEATGGRHHVLNTNNYYILCRRNTVESCVASSQIKKNLAET